MEPTVDAARLSERLDALAGIGRANGGGITRLVYSEEERAAAELVAGWMSEAGLGVRWDAVGNLFARWPDDPGASVWTGSHLDSVPNGGRFDGPAGVLASLGALEAIRAAGHAPRTPLELCVFVGEEGSRFHGGLLGSRAVVDGLSEDELASRDSQGTSLADAMRASGLDPDAACEARRGADEVSAYLELHIEQGPVLDRRDLPVGIVTGIAGPLFLEAEVTGRADHAGTTPMDARADALLGAAEVALALERIAAGAGSSTVGTVGQIHCEPGAANVVPGRATFSIDLRDIDLAARDRAEEQLRATFDDVLAARGLKGELRETLRVDPQPTPERILAVLDEAARAAGVDAVHLPSGAAHDAMVVGRLTDSGMIFVRSIDGRSHTPEELTRVEDLTAGATVLAQALVRLTG